MVFSTGQVIYATFECPLAPSKPQRSDGITADFISRILGVSEEILTIG